MVAPVKTTIRQELFLRAYLASDFNATKAWQKVYGVSSRECAQAASSRTLSKPHVKRRLSELQGALMKKSDITVDKVLNDYQYALNLAKAQEKPSEMVAAATAQAKLVGLLRERVETGGVGDFGDAHSISDILEMVSKEAGPEAAMALAAAMGLEAPTSQTTKAMEEAVLFISESPSDAVN